MDSLESKQSPDSLKYKALQLLEWALKDLSPDLRQPLNLKCGFEREGHFVPCQDVIPEPRKNLDEWQLMLDAEMKSHAAEMLSHMDPSLPVEDIYYDEGGTFLIEGVTKVLPLQESVKAIEDISAAMLTQAKAMGFSHACFGTVAISDVIQAIDQKSKELIGEDDFSAQVFKDYKGEVFGSNGNNLLAGRGQHCNLSLWSGDKPLFSAADADFMNYAAKLSLNYLPYMFLPCRAGNYLRIHADSALGLKIFSAGGFKRDKNKGHVLLYANDTGKSNIFNGRTRLEFRQGAPEADPYDLAIASALPLVKACDQGLQKGGDGKIILEDGIPKMKIRCLFPEGFNTPVPKTEEEAKKLFNHAENPYFKYLNELAERRYRQAELMPPDPKKHKEMEIAKSMRSIGSRLYEHYCQEYDMRRIHSFAVSYIS